jgi:predicted RNA-binding protein with PUA-like domain
MAYWLFKSEPDAFSWDQLKSKGEKGQEWDGVRNYAARNNMRLMKIGDKGFFYHSNAGKDVVGIAEVCALAHPDSTADNPTWECVDIRAVADIPNPINLDDIKADPALAKMILVNNSRLSVQPVTDEEYLHICKRCGLDNPPTSP